MKRIITTLLSVFIWSTLLFLAGYYYANRTHKPVIEKVEVVKTVDKIISRDYSKTDCCEHLYFYDTTPMKITYNVNETNRKYTNMDVTWRLYERQGIENINVPVYQEGNWRLYLGIGVGVLVAGGLTYMVVK